MTNFVDFSLSLSLPNGRFILESANQNPALQILPSLNQDIRQLEQTSEIALTLLEQHPGLNCQLDLDEVTSQIEKSNEMQSNQFGSVQSDSICIDDRFWY